MPADEPSRAGHDLDPLQRLFQAVCNWGRWGDDDQLGTLNLIDPGVRITALQSVRRGHPYSFGQPIVPGGADSPARLRVITSTNESARTIRDELTIAPHGFATTHIDALAHCFLDGFAYNGRARDTISRPSGLTFGDISQMAAGIMTRGVLLDVTRGRAPLPPGTVITPEHLDRAADEAEVEVRRGDAVFVRTGRALPGGDPPTPSPVRTGLHLDCLKWMHERDVAVFGGDCVDVMPSPYPGYPDHLHQVALAGMGLALLDLPDMEVLRRAATVEGAAHFLLTAAPLAIRSATGSAVNPIATF